MDIEKVKKEKIKIENHSFAGGVWRIGWLFTIGFLHLSFWKAVLAIIIWPYHIGATVNTIVGL